MFEYIQIVKKVFLFSILVFLVSLLNKNSLPEKRSILTALYQDPIQEKISKPPFLVRVKNKQFTVVPLYSYELSGLVVSHHDTFAWYDYYHRAWGDFLNIRDICVIWGENIKNESYQAMKFKSGSWTCWYSCQSRAKSNDCRSFKNECLSNNHLITADKKIRRDLRRVNRGDQVYIKGYLSKYSHGGGDYFRGTSTTRTDRGNGACETIYITDFKILKRANPIWFFIYGSSKLVMIVSLLIIIVEFFIGPAKFRGEF
ncbi:MAG: hypothetical protein PHV17_02320 [Candidatus Omnitrophica bacterium]|nr:hypothetical protein [Candidatus Omnitrophota bacterium]